VSGPDFSSYFADMEIPEGGRIDERGVLHLPSGFHHFTQMVSPLRNADSLETIQVFSYPNVDGWSDAHMRDAVAAAHADGQVAFSWAGQMFEDAWQIRGMEEFLMDMMAQPEWASHILDRLMERNILYAEAAARAGVDYIMTGDDVATQQALMFSIDVWRTFLKERWAKVYAAARAIKPDIEIWYHSDGNIETIVPELIEIGVTILNPVQPECVDPVDLKRRYGDRLVFDGTIGTQTTMPFGTPDDVRAVVSTRVKDLGVDGALILSPTHVLEPEVPVENILAFLEAAREV